MRGFAAWIAACVGVAVLAGMVWYDARRPRLVAPVAAHGTRTPDGWVATWDVSAGYPVIAPADGHLGPRVHHAPFGGRSLCAGPGSYTFTAPDGAGVLVLWIVGLDAGSGNVDVHAGDRLGVVATCKDGTTGLHVGGARLEGSRADAIFSLDRWSSLLDVRDGLGGDLSAQLLAPLTHPAGDTPPSP